MALPPLIRLERPSKSRDSVIDSLPNRTRISTGPNASQTVSTGFAEGCPCDDFVARSSCESRSIAQSTSRDIASPAEDFLQNPEFRILITRLSYEAGDNVETACKEIIKFCGIRNEYCSDHDFNHYIRQIFGFDERLVNFANDGLRRPRARFFWLCKAASAKIEHIRTLNSDTNKVKIYCLAAIRNDVNNVYKVDKSLQTDLDIIKLAVECGVFKTTVLNNEFSDAKQVELFGRWRANESVMLAAIEYHASIFTKIDPRLQRNREFAIKAVRKRAIILKYIEDERSIDVYRNVDEELILSAMDSEDRRFYDPSHIIFRMIRTFGSWDSLLENVSQSFIEKILKRAGGLIDSIPVSYRYHEQRCLGLLRAALPTYSGSYTDLADMILRKTMPEPNYEAFLLKCIKQDGKIIEALPASYRYNEEHCLRLLRAALPTYAQSYTEEAKQVLRNKMREDEFKAFIMEFVDMNPEFFDAGFIHINKVKTYCLAAIRHNVNNVYKVDESLENDQDIIELAAEYGVFTTIFGDVNFGHADQAELFGRWKANESVMLAAIEYDASIFKKIDSTLRHNREFAIKAVHKRAITLKYIEDEGFLDVYRNVDEEIILSAMDSETQIDYSPREIFIGMRVKFGLLHLLDKVSQSFMEKMLKRDGNIIDKIPSYYRYNEEHCLRLLRAAFPTYPHSYSTETDVVLRKTMPEPDYEAFLLECLKVNGEIIEALPNAYRYNEKHCLRLFRAAMPTYMEGYTFQTDQVLRNTMDEHEYKAFIMEFVDGAPELFDAGFDGFEDFLEKRICAYVP